MSGIRVSWLPADCTEKEIKIHFSKHENGGGRIQSIYYPMFNGDAVVLFEDRETADRTVSVRDQMMNGRISVGVTKLPALQAFPMLEAKLDPTVAALLQSEDKIREEIQYQFYDENVEFVTDTDENIVGIRGNWYLLEWTWAHIDEFIKQRYGKATDKHRTMHTSMRSQRQEYDDGMETDEPIISLPSGASKKNTKTLLKDPSLRKTSPEPTRQTKGQESTRQTKDQESTRQTKQMKGQEPTRQKTSSEPSIQTKGSETRQREGPESTKNTKGARKFADEDEERAGALDSSGDEQAAHTDIVIKGDTEDVCNLEFTVGTLNVGVFIGWITKVETDAIVNAAMGSLIHGGGVAYAIAKAASPEMQRQCDDYVNKHGSLRESEVMHTCAGGDLSNQVKYIIHAVGPIWVSGHGEKCCAVLTRTFLNSLRLASDLLKINSITLPLISSGIFGVPLELCVQAFLNAIVLFVDECDTVSLREVHLVNNNPDTTALTVLQLRNLISQGTDKLITEAKELLSSEASITSHARRHYSDEPRTSPRSSLLDADNVPRRTSSTTSDYTTPSPLVRVSGQKLSTGSSSMRTKMDARERTTGTRNLPSIEGASGYKSPPATSSVSRSSPGRQSSGSPNSGRQSSGSPNSGSPSSRSPRSGPPTTSYLYSTEGASGVSLPSASRTTYRSPDHKYTSSAERSPGGYTGNNNNSSTGARASGSSAAASSTYRSATSQLRSGDTRTSKTTGRPLPDAPTGVKSYTSKRY